MEAGTASKQTIRGERLDDLLAGRALLAALHVNVANDMPQAHGAQQISVVSTVHDSTTYVANALVVGRVFYLQFRVDLKEGRTFCGKVGDIASPAGGALTGDLYTANLPRLYQDTVKFEFCSDSVSTTLRFLDASGNLLGHFAGAALASPAGLGVGAGHWS